MDKFEESLKNFDEMKKEVGFKRIDVDPEHEKKMQEFFDLIGENDYATISLIGTQEDQMCGIVGQKSALVYLLLKAMLADSDLFSIVQTAFYVMQGINIKDGKGKAN